MIGKGDSAGHKTNSRHEIHIYREWFDARKKRGGCYYIDQGHEHKIDINLSGNSMRYEDICGVPICVIQHIVEFFSHPSRMPELTTHRKGWDQGI
jgi:hypothetical protein